MWDWIIAFTDEVKAYGDHYTDGFESDSNLSYPETIENLDLSFKSEEIEDF